MRNELQTQGVSPGMISLDLLMTTAHECNGGEPTISEPTMLEPTIKVYLVAHIFQLY